MRFARFALVPAALFFIACTEAKNDSQKPTPQAATAPAPLGDAEVPVPADFEEQAAKEITAANYKAELAKLEAEPN